MNHPATSPNTRRRAARRAIVATALAATAVAPVAVARPALADTASPTVTSRGVEIPPFYTPPTSLPSANGALVRHEPLPLGVGLTLPRIGTLPGTATRLMYKTTDNAGRPAAVTGAYIEPTAPWTGKGDQPLVVLAPGTMGQGDQCAASLGLEHPFVFNGRTVSVGYEDLAVYHLLAHGVAVAVTDYIGLGATDRTHTYVDRVDEGHAVLDAARAARHLQHSGISEHSKVGLFGYSQGGGATASAAELRDTYAPDVDLVGTYSGAPPADLAAVAKGIDGSALAGALGWTLNSLLQSYPQLKAVEDRHISETGRQVLADLSTACIGDGIAGYAFKKSSSWTRDGLTINQIAEEEPAIREVLDDEQLGRRTPHGPVRVATGVQDDIVPHAQARQLALDWCARGGDVTYRPVVLPDLGKRLITNHLGPLLTDQAPAVSWLLDRFEDRPATSGCATVGSQA